MTIVAAHDAAPDHNERETRPFRFEGRRDGRHPPSPHNAVFLASMTTMMVTMLLALDHHNHHHSKHACSVADIRYNYRCMVPLPQ
jgi:hypothetical protein